MKATHTVRGEIELPEGVPADQPAHITVQVEDVSRADAPSEVIGEWLLDVERLGTLRSVPFEVNVPKERIDERRLYSVRVHVAFRATGEIAKGDFLSMQSYPVLTRGYGHDARVQVRRV